MVRNSLTNFAVRCISCSLNRRVFSGLPGADEFGGFAKSGVPGEENGMLGESGKGDGSLGTRAGTGTGGGAGEDKLRGRR